VKREMNDMDLEGANVRRNGMMMMPVICQCSISEVGGEDLEDEEEEEEGREVVDHKDLENNVECNRKGRSYQMHVEE
jgi:hypothetical protein